MDLQTQDQYEERVENWMNEIIQADAEPMVMISYQHDKEEMKIHFKYGLSTEVLKEMLSAIVNRL